MYSSAPIAHGDGRRGRGSYVLDSACWESPIAVRLVSDDVVVDGMGGERVGRVMVAAYLELSLKGPFAVKILSAPHLLTYGDCSDIVPQNVRRPVQPTAQSTYLGVNPRTSQYDITSSRPFFSSTYSL